MHVFAAAEVSVWLLLLVSLCSGGLVAVANWLTTRKLGSAQTDAARLTAQEAAVEIVNTALNIAQQRIGSLEDQINILTKRIEELRDLVANQGEDKKNLQRQLDLALTQRAQLQQQLIDLSRIFGEGKIEYLANVRPPDAIVMVDARTGIISYVNDGIFGMLGYAPQELVGRSLEALVPAAQRSLHAKQREQYAAHPLTRPMGSGLPLYARRRDGADVPVDISLHPTGDGRIIALMKQREEKAESAHAATAEAIVVQQSA